MLMRFDPWRELERRATAQMARSFPMDAFRRGDMFIVQFDLPGVEPGSIETTVESNVMTITAERRPERQEGDDVIIQERPYGTFTRQLFLGDQLDAERIEASYERGVLTLTIPVAETAKPRRIEIHGENGDRTIEGQEAQQQQQQGSEVPA